MQGEGKDQRRQWDQTYAVDEFFGAEPSHLGRSALELFERRGARRVLELGCGQGRDTWLFLSRGLEVIALDYSETGICHMRERARGRGGEGALELRVHDVRQGIPLEDASVDAVYSHMFFTMELTEREIARILAECRRVLRPGGVNVFSVRNDHDPDYGRFEPRGEGMYRNPRGFVVHFFTEDKLRRLSADYNLLGMKEFSEGSPPLQKRLYEVVLEKP
jgi:SAM-dependent methyltransferase